jgi:hypothetical protein
MVLPCGRLFESFGAECDATSLQMGVLLNSSNSPLHSTIPTAQKNDRTPERDFLSTSRTKSKPNRLTILVSAPALRKGNPYVRQNIQQSMTQKVDHVLPESW